MRETVKEWYATIVDGPYLLILGCAIFLGALFVQISLLFSQLTILTLLLVLFFRGSYHIHLQNMDEKELTPAEKKIAENNRTQPKRPIVSFLEFLSYEKYLFIGGVLCSLVIASYLAVEVSLFPENIHDGITVVHFLYVMLLFLYRPKTDISTETGEGTEDGYKYHPEEFN